jgi:hypothetical protein
MRARLFTLTVLLVMACGVFNPMLMSAQDPDDMPAADQEIPAAGFEVPAAEPDAPGGQAEVPAAEPGIDVPPPPDVDVEGELDVLYEDDDDNPKMHHFLHENGRRRELRFRHGAPDVPSGTRIRVTGNDLGEGTIEPVSINITSGITARTMGGQDALVILINFSNNPTQPYTPSTAAAVNQQVRNFYLENSYGQTVMNFSVAGWFTIAASDAGCDYYTWASQAEAAASNAGFNVNAYDRRIIAFPKAASCSWWGMGNLSGPRSWVNGNYALRVVAHEQAHNFGNHHAHSKPCDAQTCGTVEYGDDRDILGASGIVGHLNAFAKERLGWLNYGASPAIQTVTSSDDYWIDNYEAIGGGARALKIWNPNTSTYYYVESRAKTGFDANANAGVTIHTGSPTVANSSYQLDMAPTTTSWTPTLAVGEVFTDPAMELTIQTLSSGLTGALIRVGIGGSSSGGGGGTEPPPPPPACVEAAPTVALAWASPMHYTVSITTNKSDGCAPSSIGLTATVPSGWSGSFSPASFSSIPPGSTISSTLTLVAPAGASGTFPFSAKVTDGSYSTTASGSLTLVAITTLEVSTSVSMTSDRKGNNKSAAIKPAVKSGQSAVANASVTVEVTKPNGVKSTMTGTTAADGTTSFNYPIKPKDPKGTYQVKTNVSKDGATATTTTSFVVQ